MLVYGLKFCFLLGQFLAQMARSRRVVTQKEAMSHSVQQKILSCGAGGGRPPSPPRCTDSSDTAPLSSTQVTAAGVTEFGGGGVASAVTVCWDKVRAGLLKCRKDQVSATVNIKGVFVLSASFVSFPLIFMSILDTSCMCKQFLDNIIRQFLTNCTFNICL